MRHMLFRLLPAFALLLMAPTFALADVFFGDVSSTAPSTPPGEQAVFLSAGTGGTNSGGLNYFIAGVTSITGTAVNISTNNDGSSGLDQLFALTSTDLRSNQYPEPPSPGDDTSLDQLTITLSGSTFGDTYMNLFGAFPGTTTASFTVVTNDGTFTHIYDGLEDGNNWVFITTANGETISSVSIDSRFYSLRDLHVSDVQESTVPEPASLALLGTGLLWVGRKLKR